MPSGSRLVASRCTRGQRRTIASAVLAQPPIRCSQLSTTISTSCSARASSSASSAGRPGWAASRSASRDGRRHRVLVGDRGQLRQPHPVPGPVQQLGGHLQPQPGLAAPAGPGQGDQARGLHQGPDLGHLPVPADERRQLGRADCSAAPGCPATAAAGTPRAGPPPCSWKIRSGRPRSFSRCTAQIGQRRARRQPVPHQHRRRLRHQHLPPVADRGHPGGPVHLQAHQARWPSAPPPRNGCPSAPGPAPRPARHAPAMACCICSTAATHPRGEENTAKNASPCVSTSRPPCAASADRISA